MVNLVSRKEQFINGLVDKAGWEKERAEEHFMHFAPMFEIGNEIDFVTSETKRLAIKVSENNSSTSALQSGG